MACEEFQIELSAFVDGELTGPERARLAAHLQTCLACSALLRQFEEASTLVRELGTPRAPVFVTDAAMRLVRAMPQPAASPWTETLRQLLFEPFLPKFAMGAAALAAVAVLAVLVGQHEFANDRGGATPGTLASSDSAGTAVGAPADGGFRLSSAPDNPQADGMAAARAGYDFREAQNHGRRDIHSLNARERFAWDHGVWRHEQRFGRDGWWWEVSGAWYWYDQPASGPPAYVSEIRFAGDRGLIGSDARRPTAVAAPQAPAAAQSARPGTGPQTPKP